MTETRKGSCSFVDGQGQGHLSAREGGHLGSVTLGQGVGQAAHQEAGGGRTEHQSEA